MRPKRLLFILIGILALSVLYAIWATPRPETRPDRGQASSDPGRAEAVGNDRGEQWPRLKKELLLPADMKYPGFKRDIFGPLSTRPKPAPRPAAPPPQAQPQVDEPPQMPPLPREEIRDALSVFTFLGLLDKDGSRTVFLSKGEEIFVVKIGESFGENGRFAVVDITPEQLSIRQKDDQRLITIPLIEKDPLVPSFESMP